MLPTSAWPAMNISGWRSIGSAAYRTRGPSSWRVPISAGWCIRPSRFRPFPKGCPPGCPRYRYWPLPYRYQTAWGANRWPTWPIAFTLSTMWRNLFESIKATNWEKTYLSLFTYSHQFWLQRYKINSLRPENLCNLLYFNYFKEYLAIFSRLQ